MARIGIIGAMDSEIGFIHERLAGRVVEECYGMEFCSGTLGGTDVVVVRCGIGKVNAALCAQLLVLRFGVTHVINTGTAGSLDASIDIGDIVVSSDLVYHDFDVSGLGYAPGVVPDMEETGKLSFEANPALRALVVSAAAEVAPEIRAHEGRIASGDQFLNSAAEKERIVSTFGALCCEMEGTAIAHACYLAGVPCVVVRAISDKADGSSHMDYRSFEALVAERGARIVARVVQGL